MKLRFLLQDTPQVHPCRLDGRIPAANGPVEETSVSSSSLAMTKMQ
jgi:hypothetical protein